MAGKKSFSGKKSIEGFHAKENKIQRSAFKIKFKLAILEYFDAHGMSITIDHFWPEMQISQHLLDHILLKEV